MPIELQVGLSVLLVIAVFWFMWRLPHGGERFFGWGPPLALGSVWTGLAGLALSGLLWVLPYPDRWVSATFLLFDPAAIAMGALVLWIYRGQRQPSQTIAAQRMQAKVGITLGVLAVAAGYLFVMLSKPPGSVIGS